MIIIGEKSTQLDRPSLRNAINFSGLLPLPFEVQTEEVGQRYPALNVRLGSPDDEPGATPSTSPAPDNYTTENSTLMQSDEPDIYDYDYTAPLSEHSFMSTPTTLIEDYSSQEGRLEEEQPIDIPETPESHLLYHADDGQHSPGGEEGEDDPLFLPLSSYDLLHQHNHPGIEAQTDATHRSQHTSIHSTPSSIPHSRADREDSVDGVQTDSHAHGHSPLPIAPTPTPMTHRHSFWSESFGETPRTDEELVLASQQRQFVDQEEVVERFMYEQDRNPAANEREQTVARRPSTEARPSTERDDQGRKGRRERQRGAKVRRNRARRLRGVHMRRRG